MIRILLVILSTLLLQPAPAAESISPLGSEPDWSSLERFQETMTREEFLAVMRNVYCTRGYSAAHFDVGEESVRLLADQKKQTWFTMRFAPTLESRRPVTVPWKRAETLPPAPEGRPLEGLKIALDPGHIGGRWAKMEERWFQVGDSRPVQEGDMTLLVAKLLKPKLETLGATVTLVREKNAPATAKRPGDLTAVSREILRRAGTLDPRMDYSGPADPEKEQTIRWQNERLFYRNSEIRERARRVNSQLQPDVVLCLHFNAEAWNDPARPTLTDRNHLHLLVNGAYLPPELEFDDVRFEMLERLFSRVHEEELPLAESVAEAMAKATGLPPYEYTTDNATKIGSSPYLYARNLVATRLFRAPVIYFEPYVMNSDEVFWRVQEGDYEGVRNVNGTDRPSIFREYADSVAAGLVEYYRAARPPASKNSERSADVVE